MQNYFVSIIGIGLIGEDKTGGLYRQAVFRDLHSSLTADMLVYKKERPMLWDDLDKIERGNLIPPYRGSVIRYNGINLIVLGDETPEKAWLNQHYKLKLCGRLSHEEAEQMRKMNQGYITNLTRNGTMEMGWNVIQLKSRLIQFRKYTGNGVFQWSGWYEIV